MTYAQMLSRLLDELQRPDLASQAQEAIQSAIAYYRRRPVVPNQASFGPTASVANQQAYDLPADFVSMIDLTVTANGMVYQLQQVTPAELQFLYPNSDSVETGVPQFYALYNDQFLVEPRAPSTDYEFNGKYVSSLAAPTEDDDEGFWMNDAERAVRCRAKAILYDDVIIEPELADREYAKSKEEWSEITKEAEARAYARGVRPWG